MSNETSGGPIRVALIVLVFVQAAANTIWLVSDRRLPFWDEYRYFEMTDDFAEALADRGLAGFRQVLDGHPSHPPLFPILSVPFYVAFGHDFFAARYVLVPLGALLSLLMFSWARRLSTPATGLLAALIASGLPAIAGYQHLFYTEAALMPILVLSLIILQHSDDLSRRGASLAFGAAAGLGALVKWTFPLFLVVPVAMALIQRRQWKGLLCAFGIALAIAGPWLTTHLDGLWRFAATGVFSGEGGLSTVGHSILSVESLCYYPREIVLAGVGVTLAVFMIPCVWLFRKLLRLHADILIGIAFPILVFTAIPTKQLRHVVPVFPMIALLIALGVDRVRSRPLRLAVYCATALVAVLSFVQTSFSILGDGPHLSIMDRRLAWFGEKREPGAPDARTWPVADAIDLIVRNIAMDPPAEHPPEVLVLFNLTAFRADGFRYVARQQRLALEFPDAPFFYPQGHSGHRHIELPLLLRVRYYLVKTGTQWVRFVSGIPVHRTATAFAEELLDPSGPVRRSLILLGRLHLPDGSLLDVLRRPDPIPPGVAAAIGVFALALDDDDPDAMDLLNRSIPPPAEIIGEVQARQALGTAVTAERLEQVLQWRPDDDSVLRQLAELISVASPMRSRRLASLADEAIWGAVRPDAPERSLAIAAMHAEDWQPYAAVRELRRAIEGRRSLATRACTVLRQLRLEPFPDVVDPDWIREMEMRLAPR